MQAKGYDWRAIASLLSEHGIAINVVTLKSYLQRAKAEARPHRKRRAGEGAEPRKARGSGKDTGRGTAKAGEDGTQGRSEDAPETPAGAPKEAAVGASKSGGACAQEAVSRPWAFVPEEDTDDI